MDTICDSSPDAMPCSDSPETQSEQTEKSTTRGHSASQSSTTITESSKNGPRCKACNRLVSVTGGVCMFCGKIVEAE
jgi:hypothetical protein